MSGIGLAALEREIDTLLCGGAFPGCVVLIARNGEIVYNQAFGDSVALPRKIKARVETIYDTASLTKPLITTALTLHQIEEKEIGFDTTLGELIDGCPEDKRFITVTDLLTHRSGIVAWYPLFAFGDDLESYVESILSLPLAVPPRKETIYSCPGFVVLAYIIESIAGKRFADLANELIISPLNLKRTSLGRPAFPLEEIAATEDGSHIEREMSQPYGVTFVFRDGIIWGETHDTNSHVVGGSAGNAGLFTTAAEAFILTEQWGPRSKLFKQETLAGISENLTPFGPQHRSLGWQLASSPDCSACSGLSRNSIGHTGFTGCSIWFDRELDFIFALFTNRIHPQASKADMVVIRRQLCSLALQALPAEG